MMTKVVVITVALRTDLFKMTFLKFLTFWLLVYYKSRNQYIHTCTYIVIGIPTTTDKLDVLNVVFTDQATRKRIESDTRAYISKIIEQPCTNFILNLSTIKSVYKHTQFCADIIFQLRDLIITYMHRFIRSRKEH